MKWGPEYPGKHDMGSLRLLGTVGEPINPEAWMWYHETVGGGRCPIVDTWWQTETGGPIITPPSGVDALKAGPCPAALSRVVARLPVQTRQAGGARQGGVPVI